MELKEGPFVTPPVPPDKMPAPRPEPRPEPTQRGLLPVVIRLSVAWGIAAVVAWCAWHTLNAACAYVGDRIADRIVIKTH